MDKASTVKELSEDIWRLVILAFIQVSFSSYVSKSQNFFYIYIHSADNSTIVLILEEYFSVI